MKNKKQFALLNILAFGLLAFALYLNFGPAQLPSLLEKITADKKQASAQVQSTARR